MNHQPTCSCETFVSLETSNTCYKCGLPLPTKQEGAETTPPSKCKCEASGFEGIISTYGCPIHGEHQPSQGWEESVAIKGGNEMMPGYMRECLIPFIRSLLSQRNLELRKDVEGLRKRTIGTQTGTGFKVNKKAEDYNQCLADILAMLG